MIANLQEVFVKKQDIRLRADAEKKLSGNSDTLPEITSKTPEELIHELRVHQIELEMMNEELRKANLAAEAARDRYADLYDFAPVGYFTFTRDGTISEVNLTGASMLGIERRKLINCRFRKFISPEYLDLWDSHFMSVLHHENRQTCQLKILSVNPPLFYARLDSIRLESDDKKILVRCTVSDITELLDENKKRYLNLLDNAAIGIFQSKTDGKVLMVNPEFARMFGYESPEEFCATVKDVGTDIFADPQRRTEIIRIHSENPDLKEFENLYRRKDGSTFWGQLNVRLIMDSDGNILYIEGFVKDITERKQAEEALRESEIRFREVLEHSSDAAYRRNLKTDTYDYISPAFTRISGYTPDEMKAMSIETVLSLIHPDDFSETERILAKSMSHPGTPYCLEYRFRHKDGQYRWFEDKIRVTCDEQGQPLFRVGSVRDISRRKQAEEALRESEVKYRTLFEKANEGIWLVDNQAITTMVNPYMADMLGYSVSEITGHSLFEFMEERWADYAHQIFEKCLRGIGEQFEFFFRRKDGSELWTLISVAPVIDDHGTLLHAYGMVTDITERKQTEKALQESEAKYRTIFETAREGIFQIDENFNITLLNQHMADMLGYTVEKIQGRSVSDFIIGCDMKNILQLEAEQRQNLLEKFDWRIRCKGGSELWAIVSGKPVMTDDGQFSYGFVMVTDITERKKAEKALRDTSLYTRSLIEASLDPLVTIGYDGKITDVNNATESVTGYSRKKLIGSNFADYFTEPDRAEAGYNQVFETGSVRDYELHIRHKNGKITPVLYNASVYRDQSGSITGVFAAARDITERKHIEEMLKQKGEQYRSFIENMSEGFIVFNQNMEVAYVNDQFCRMTGYEEEDVIGKTVFHHFDEDNQKIMREQFIKRRKGEGTPYKVESIRKDGSRMFISVSPKSVLDSEGVFQGSFAVINDITLLITEQQAMKTQVETITSQIDKLNMENEEYNHALKILLKNSQNEQKAVEEKIVANVREMVSPFLNKLKKTRLSETQKSLLDVAEKNINDIISPFVSRLKSEMRDFTPMEIQVATLVREGKTNTEIGDILGISEYTAMFHRRNIREKLGLKYQKINLRTYLLSLSTP
jgi:PAS domain S-box-containing protein